MYPEWLPEPLEPVVARLARVDDCFAEIADMSERWSLQALELKQLRRRDDRVRTVVDKVRPIPPTVPVLFSDAINHLRAVLDNVVWHLVTTRSELLDERAARDVALPIYQDAAGFAQWASKVRRRVPELGLETSTTHQRVRAVQPFVDSARIPSMAPQLAAVMGVEVEDPHPLLLLQAYSNLDKHRAITLMVGRAMINPLDDENRFQGRTFEELKPGSAVGPDGFWGQVVHIESNAAVMMQRPSPWTAVVSPAAELRQLRDWVRNNALPILVTGSREASPAVPVTIDMSDDGRSLHERISDPRRISGAERASPSTIARLVAAETQPPTYPPVVREEFDD